MIKLKKLNEENKAILVLDKVLRSNFKGIGLIDMFDTEVEKGRTIGKFIDIKNISKDEFSEFTENNNKSIKGLSRIVECNIKIREFNPNKVYQEDTEIPVYGIVGCSDIIGSFCVIDNKIVMYAKRQSSMRFSNKVYIELLVDYLKEQGFEVKCYEKEFYEDSARDVESQWVLSKEAFENE